jgi:hypothetical protein
VTTHATLIVQGSGFSYRVFLNDDDSPALSDSIDPGAPALRVHPLASLLLDGENTFKVGGTPTAPGGELQLVLGTEQVGDSARALVEGVFTESFGATATLDIAPGDGLPRQLPTGLDIAFAQGPVQDLFAALESGDASTIERLLLPVAQFWDSRDETGTGWEESGYLRHLRLHVEDPDYALRPLNNLSFVPAAGGRLQVPMQGDASAFVFQHREDPDALFEFQFGLAPTPDGWVFLR